MTYPSFNVGETLRASDMNAVGLWRVNNCTVSSVGGTAATASNGVITVGAGNTSVTVNNAFSADYENYKIIYSGGQSSAAVNLALQLTVGGTASTTAYYGGLVWVNLTTAVVAGATDNNGSGFTFAGGAAGANDGAVSLNVDILQPFATKRTRLHNAQTVYDVIYGTYTGLHDVATSYNGFRVTPGAGTLTGGTIRVYGYRN